VELGFRNQRLRFGILLLIFPLASSSQAAGNMQLVLNRLMRGRRGAVIVSNPQTGKLVAIWNPQTAFNRAFRPGSTAKVVATAAALEEGVLSASDRILCRRVPKLLGEAYHCSHPETQTPYTLSSALANSCNYFFAELSTRLSPAVLAHWYAVFGFGGEGERAPTDPIRIGNDDADKARAVLGEAAVTTTPEQLLLAYSAIATRGKVFRLQGSPKKPELLRTVLLQQETFAVLESGLEECVSSGMCRAAALPGIRVAGKTGTATYPDGSGVTHAWFVGYAPADSPEIALVVFLERGTGMRDAAPLAGRILQFYFAQEKPKP